ncbi:MAG: serine O-acetyltransferase [Lachnospiraceae bacterium]|jgi:serine O-acetyltransferase|nr:serine O-acetyltransferase [Lachnospiraceae bacterium]
MHGVDWFYEIDLPIHFLVEHPVGSVLGRAKYGDYFFVYQGTTVGGNRSKGQLCYPTIGQNVIMFANATILGDTHIGNKVVISAGTYIINEDVPDNCIVFGKSPNLAIKRKNEPEMKKYTQHIWGWRIEE